MTNRERWILYPLLVLALALGVKAAMGPTESEFNTVVCRRMQCNEVVVLDPVSGRRIARLGMDVADREAKFVLLDEKAQPAVTLAVAGEKAIGTIEVETVRVRHPESRKQIVEIGAAAKLGQLTFYGEDDTKAAVTLGAGEQGAVLQLLRGGKMESWPAGERSVTPEKRPSEDQGPMPERPAPPEAPEEK